MKKILFFLVSLMLMPVFCAAQDNTDDFEAFKKEVYGKYTNWYVSVYGGLPFTQGGDMVTLAEDKTYLGYMGGLQIGYQMTPFFGMSLTGQYGQMDAGAKDVEVKYLLQPDGKAYYGATPPAGAMDFKDLYSTVKHITAGLHFDFNIASLLCGSENRKIALVLSPAVYMQKFDPIVKKVSDDARFTTSDLKNDPDFGVGGDLDFRYRASKHMDVLLKTGAAWIHNNNFDGIDNVATELKYGALGHIALGLVFKLGNSGDKIDNLIYAPNNKRINEMHAEMLAAQEEVVVVEEPTPTPPPPPAVVEEVKEEPKQEVVVVKEFPSLPAIHFAFDSYKVDPDKYATELATIVSVLKEFDDVSVDVIGYTDHKGTNAYNDVLSMKRAKAVKDYLIGQGIDGSRLNTIGRGEDPTTYGEEALTIKARRAEVAK